MQLVLFLVFACLLAIIVCFTLTHHFLLQDAGESIPMLIQGCPLKYRPPLQLRQNHTCSPNNANSVAFRL